MNKTYALIRYSSDKQTIESQLESIKNYCQQNNIELLEEHIIIESAISGWKTEPQNRDGLKTVLALVEQQLIDTLIIFMTDRIGRRTDLLPFITKLTLAGVKIISTNEGIINKDTDVDELLSFIRLWQSQGESKKISARVKAGLLAKQKEKANYFHGGKILIGYKVINKKLMVDDTKANIIKKVYQLYIDFGTSKAIDYLASVGIKRNPYSLLRMLKNTTYKGVIQHHKKNYSEADYNEITYYNKELAIVSESIWNRANELIQKRHRVKNGIVRNDFRSKFTYEGLMFCTCGGKLNIEYDYRPKIPRLYLLCRRCKNNKVTTQKSFSIRKLEPQIEKAINQVLEYELNREKLEQYYQSRKNNNIELLNQMLKLKQDELHNKNRAINNSNEKLKLLLASTDVNISSIEIVTDTIKVITKEAENLKQQISELEQQINQEMIINQEQNNKIELFTKLRDVYKLASADRKKQILNILIDRIVVSNDYSYKIKVYLNY